MASRADIKFDWNNQGFRDILQSDGVQGVLLEKADDICDRANSNIAGLGKKYADSTGYKASVTQSKGADRAFAHVRTTDFKSKLAEAHHNSLKGAM